MLKRFISMLLAAVMLLSLVGCGSTSESTKAKNGFYKVCGVYYPEELGAPVLGEAVAGLDLPSAVEQITNVGDAIYYLHTSGAHNGLFVELIADDYEEIGEIHLRRADAQDHDYAVIYIKAAGHYYPFDFGQLAHIHTSRKDYVSDSDLEALCKKLGAAFPRPAGVKMNSWAETLRQDGVAVSDSNLNIEASSEESNTGGENFSNYGIPKTFGVAQYSAEEIRAMKNYSAEELQEAISTIADMVQYIIENDYGDNPVVLHDLHFDCGGYDWSVSKSPNGALLSQTNSCGSVSNLARYVLEDDYDEEGYVGWMDRFTNTGAGGGHVFNYFKRGDTILTVDFTIPVTDSALIMGTGNCWVLKSFDEITGKVLAKTKEHPSQANRVFFAVFVERDVHRDCAPRASSINNGKFVAFLDAAVKDEIELLHFNEEWLKGDGSHWYEYHPFFEGIGVTNAVVPKELIDSADMDYYEGVVFPSELTG
ncbi:MAG: hypothetical protein J6J01_07695 [Oscillospiraceae bacterium]|nr:hypothetical protein [Oscillospiraceae bacterium]